MAFGIRRILSFNSPLKLQILALVFLAPLLSYSQINNWESKLHSDARKMGGDFYFIGLQEIADILKTHTYYSNKVRKAVLYLNEDKITLTAFNPFVVVGDEVLQMPIDTKYENGEIFVPVKFFIPILNRLIHSNSFLSNGKSADFSDIQKNISGVFVEEKINGTLIRVQTLKQFNKDDISTRYSSKWLYVDVVGGKIEENNFTAQVDKGLVRKVVPVQMEQLAQLSFQLKNDVAGKIFGITQQKGEIWISIPWREKVDSDIIKQLQTDQKKWLFDRIIIDPGHGGKDPGTIGATGVYEKDVVLAIAKKVRNLLRKKTRVEVLMTRETDKYISLKERTRFANKNQAKLFISIHANWNRNSRVGGATTYFLGLAKSEEALDISQRENAVIKYDNETEDYGNLTDENIILATMAQNAYNKESQEFAAMIQKSFKGSTNLRDRGVKQAGFYVLVGASMPNVLIETAFLSNKREERLLRSSSFQNKAAKAIFNSIKEFIAKNESFVQN